MKVSGDEINQCPLRLRQVLPIVVSRDRWQYRRRPRAKEGEHNQENADRCQACYKRCNSVSGQKEAPQYGDDNQDSLVDQRIDRGIR
jgi:hypothetical protein